MEKADRIKQLADKIRDQVSSGSTDGAFLNGEDLDMIIASLETWEDIKKEIEDRLQSRAYSEYQFGENHGLEEAVNIIEKYIIGENTLKLGNSSVTWTDMGQMGEEVSFY